MTKTAENHALWGTVHTYIAHIREYPKGYKHGSLVTRLLTIYETSPEFFFYFFEGAIFQIDFKIKAVLMIILWDKWYYW